MKRVYLQCYHHTSNEIRLTLCYITENGRQVPILLCSQCCSYNKMELDVFSQVKKEKSRKFNTLQQRKNVNETQITYSTYSCDHNVTIVVKGLNKRIKRKRREDKREGKEENKRKGFMILSQPSIQQISIAEHKPTFQDSQLERFFLLHQDDIKKVVVNDVPTYIIKNAYFIIFYYFSWLPSTQQVLACSFLHYI